MNQRYFIEYLADSIIKCTRGMEFQFQQTVSFNGLIWAIVDWHVSVI